MKINAQNQDKAQGTGNTRRWQTKRQTKAKPDGALSGGGCGYAMLQNTL